MTAVIVTANQKGGCGKTTTSISLAAGLAMRGYEVTVVDCDPQINASQAFGLEDEDLDGKFTIADIYLNKRPADQTEMHFPDRFDGRLHLIPGSKGLSSLQLLFDTDIQTRLARQEITPLEAQSQQLEQWNRLRVSLNTLRGKRDFIFIDTGPELALIATTTLIAADYYLVPIVPSAYDLQGLKRLDKSARQIREKVQPNLSLLGVLLTKIKAKTKLDMQVRELLQTIFTTEEIFQTEISDSVRHRECTLHGISIHEHAPGEPASQQYLALADEVLKRLNNPKPMAAAAGQGSEAA